MSQKYKVCITCQLSKCSNSFRSKNHPECFKCIDNRKEQERLERVEKRKEAFSIKKKNIYVYVISNPAFPGFYKIGRAYNVKNRLDGYQTSDPYRRYKIEFTLPTKKIKEIETFFKIHMVSRYEWVACDLDTIVNNIIKINNGMI